VTDVEIRVVEDPARQAAALLIEHASAGGNIALSGGSTPGRVYELAAQLHPDWSRAHVWFGDERAVPPDDSRSNYRLIRTTLLDSLSRSPEVHRIRGERPAEEAAALYDEELDGVTLDLALNGIGPDGHTASLFPGSPALGEQELRAVAAKAGLEPYVPRVTMTPRVFAEAAVLVLADGDQQLLTGPSGQIGRGRRSQPRWLRNATRCIAHLKNGLAHPDDVAYVKRSRAIDPLAVHERAVHRPEILDRELSVGPARGPRVAARDLGIVAQPSLGPFGRAADEQVGLHD